MTKFFYTQPYVIISAFILRDEKLLLIQENQPPDVGKWNLPGGKLDFGENPLEAVKREAFEESGLDFKPTALLGVSSIYRNDVPVGPKQLHVIRIAYVGTATGSVSLEYGEPIDGVEEIANYKWLSLHDVLKLNNSELRYHDVKSLVSKLQHNKTYPLELVERFTQ